MAYEGETPERIPHPPVRIDLGCGTKALPGFVGVDHSPLPGVDVVADLERPLPVADSCADLVHASHSLEHVRNLVPVMEEIWRICRPGAQVAIVAPYGQQGLNLANPFHHEIFNEHSPRFWTDAGTCTVDAAEWYRPPHGTIWGLSTSEHTRPRLDLRLVRMEFLYFDRYRNFPPWLQRKMRLGHLDVCDQVIYHLVAVKPPMTDEDVQRVAATMDPYVPAWIEPRRGRRAETFRDRVGRCFRQLAAMLHP